MRKMRLGAITFLSKLEIDRTGNRSRTAGASHDSSVLSNRLASRCLPLSLHVCLSLDFAEQVSFHSCCGLQPVACVVFAWWIDYSPPLKFVNPLEFTSNNMKLVHWPLMGGLLHLVQRGGDWAGPQPAQSPPRCTKCNSPLINGQCTNHSIAV